MMNRRRGVTLLEVLIAIFVMGIGMLALLTLFPVGALQMAQALKDNRTRQAAANAAAVATALNLRGAVVMDTLSQSNAPVVLRNLPGYDGPGFPVYVDPVGLPANPTTGDTQVGGFSNTLLRVRRTPLPGITPQRALALFGIADDVEFQPNGLAVTAGGNNGVVARKNRYTWAYLVRRPRYHDPASMELSVVVYAGRNLVNALDEPLYSVAADVAAGQTSLVLASSGSTPPLRAGGWILDATPEVLFAAGSNTQVLDAVKHGPVRSYFYRVVEVKEVAGGLQVELQTPLRAPLTTARSQVVVMTNVAEVFEKGTGWQP